MCVVQVLQGVVGAVLSGLLLRGALREERRFVLAWLACAGLGISFLFKACVIETLAIVAQDSNDRVRSNFFAAINYEDFIRKM